VTFKVTVVPGDELAAPLRLLEGSLRDGEPIPEAFVRRLRESVEAGDLEVLAAWRRGLAVGIAVMAYRPSIAAGGDFASIEELFVAPGERRRGIGRALLAAVEERCAARHVSYVEVQAVDDEAAAFYSALGYEEEAEVRVLSRSYPL
jgi:GNAT superfamily N-acetyltransferase